MTGWYGQQEAFTYVSVDLASIHRVKAILVKVSSNVMSPDVQIHPECSFIWKFPGLPYSDESAEFEKESRQNLWLLLLGQLECYVILTENGHKTLDI